ncbi:exopolysaccharide transport family protein [Nitrobacter sp.]|uniref:GumC family protein n=1 Tax=unclassified Nitrobacter TaxID=2620411 RepID=UPI002B7B2435|nr:exopolysaccharide transport family protein [Nitrobacter sp.]
MRFAFWRAGKTTMSDPETKSEPVASAPVQAASEALPNPELGDLDLRSIGRVLLRKKRFIIIPTLLAFALSLFIVNLITPRYKSEARILIDGRENVFLRPSGERNDERNAVDPEAVASQVQLVLSRDLAREVIRKNNLAENPEFDPVLNGVSPLKSLLALFGIGRDPLRMTPEERVLEAYYDRLTAYAVEKSRVIVIEFQSIDPELAASIANSIADGYLVLQLNARQEQAKAAGQWLSGEIDNLRKKVADAESRVEEFRSKSSLFIGINNTSLSNQQLGEINTQLNNARALKSDAESKARLIRGMLESGRPIEASEVLNSELIRRLSEQRVTLRAQLAEQSSTLLGRHPRIRELRAQLADLDRQLREEAGKISRSLENDARIASGRVESLSSSLDQLKKLATSSNGDDVKLRALEREARAQRDLLESYLAKYREATTRENIDAAPSDGRIISRAIVSNTPAYPKKLPIVLIATLATLMLTAGTIVTGELLRITSPRSLATVQPAAPVMRGVRVDPAPAAELADIAHLADDLRAAGKAAHKITIMGTGENESIMLAALALARLLTDGARVVLIDLSPSSAALTTASVDAAAPGLADLMLGEVSFGQVITRDRLSPLHLVGAGRSDADRSLLQSPRLAIALDALLRVYDHVLLVAGTATDLPAKLLTEQARAVVVPDPSMNADARMRMSGQLKAIGFTTVTMLDPASIRPDMQIGPREAA